MNNSTDVVFCVREWVCVLVVTYCLLMHPSGPVVLMHVKEPSVYRLEKGLVRVFLHIEPQHHNAYKEYTPSPESHF